MRLKSLDGWRGIGAILVALGHLEFGGYVFLGNFLWTGYILVDFFFVFSGFVIAYAYGETVRDGKSFRSFIIKRFGRIWPLHIFVLSLFVAVELAKLCAMGLFDFTPRQLPFTDSRSLDLLIPNILLLQTFGFGDDLSWNYPSWSVAAEFWTYVLFAIVTWATFAPSRRRLRLVVAGLLMVGFGLGIVFFSPNGMNATWDFGFVRCAYGFFLGMLTFAAMRSGRLAWLKGTTVEVAFGVGALTFTFTCGNTYAEFIAPFVFAPLIVVYAHDSGRVSQLFSTAPMQALGRWSYSIYLVHAFILTCMMSRIVETILPFASAGTLAQTLLTIAVYFALVIALSAFTYRFVEMTGQTAFNRLADRLAGKRPKPAPHVAPLAVPAA